MPEETLYVDVPAVKSLAQRVYSTATVYYVDRNGRVGFRARGKVHWHTWDLRNGGFTKTGVSNKLPEESRTFRLRRRA